MRCTWFVGALLATLAAGCVAKPKPADRGEALAALRAALEAWQGGERPEALLQRHPSIQVADPAWGEGMRLARYEIEEEEAQISGYDLSCPVKLWFGDGKGEPRRVRFSVATRPRLVIARDFGG